jgi:hypothetical protein
VEHKERWMELCEQASNEPDPIRLLQLVQQINAVLEEKEARLKTEPRSSILVCEVCRTEGE